MFKITTNDFQKLDQYNRIFKIEIHLIVTEGTLKRKLTESRTGRPQQICGSRSYNLIKGCIWFDGDKKSFPGFLPSLKFSTISCALNNDLKPRLPSI